MAKKKKGKTIRHMGMTMTDKEHEQWHKEHKELSPEEHEQLMKHMGISPEEDEKWHEVHRAMTPENHVKMAEMLEKKGISKEEQEKWHRDQKSVRAQPDHSDAGPLNPFIMTFVISSLKACPSTRWLVRTSPPGGYHGPYRAPRYR